MLLILVYIYVLRVKHFHDNYIMNFSQHPSIYLNTLQVFLTNCIKLIELADFSAAITMARVFIVIAQRVRRAIAAKTSELTFAFVFDIYVYICIFSECKYKCKCKTQMSNASTCRMQKKISNENTNVSANVSAAMANVQHAKLPEANVP